MRHLWIIRHGKSADGPADHTRPLNDRGLRDGPRMAAWYSEQSQRASWIWCSTATRAQMTGQFVAEGFGGELVNSDALYLSSPDTLLDQLCATPDSETCAAVVAHNPGLTYLTNILAGEHITDNLVTFGSVLFTAPIDSWVDLRPGICELQTLVTPKTLP